MKKGNIHNFFNELQGEHLQSLGFTRVNQTFARDKDGYTERFYFRSNGDIIHGRNFYLYIGVEFRDLPEISPPLHINTVLNILYAGKRKIPHAHWVSPARRVALDDNFDNCASFKLYGTTNYAALIRNLSAYIPFTSDALSSESESIRRECEQYLQEEADNPTL